MGSLTPLSSVQLHIIIVGAGIAGLAAATALRKAGHKVQLFERSNFSNEVGAAVTLSPNGTRVLRELGFNFKTAGGVRMQHMNIYNPFTLEPLNLNDVGDVEGMCGAPFEAYHRSDLHAELLRLARETNPSETPVELFKGVRISRVDADNATVELVDGTVYKGDLLIGADGLHSAVRAAAVKDNTPPIDSCWQIYRFLLPKQTIMDDDVLKSMKLDSGRLMFFIPGEEDTQKEVTRFVWYPCRNGDIQNFAGFYLGDRDETKVEDFGQFAEKDKVSDLFGHLHPNLIRSIQHADKILYWRIYERIPLDTYVYGRTLLIGNAGHPMTPFTAQGATQTLEDAGALLSVFSNLNSKGDLPKRMQAYDKVRITRTRRIQSSSSTALRSGKPNPLVERKQEYEDEDKMLPKNMGGVMDKARFEKEKFLWDFKYDVFKHSQEVMSEE